MNKLERLGINHAVSAALHMTKQTDPPEIQRALIAAALWCQQEEAFAPVGMLDVSDYLAEPEVDLWGCR